ncbi:CvpA family protein [Flavobacterium sp. Sd200]|uniref:CvpA family protein n=1 Tax=Flavobacterium sp. Sd200 TaxID=2692211 RepID=UPI001371BB70|nr:CvpA family protein [Flavobacterium sp. Sd200]MXN92562.1 CvpA family protein [Flavobacterium sp. Sd200]
MEFIDIILGGLLLYGLIKGLWNGLITELASLVSLFIGIFVAVKFSGYVGTLLASHVEDVKYISVIAFALTFIAVVVGIILLAKVFTKLAGLTGLGIPNRILGAIFGLMKMVLILSVSLNFFIKVNASGAFAKQETLKGSIFFYPVLSVSNYIFPVLEEWFAEYNQNNAQQKTP